MLLTTIVLLILIVNLRFSDAQFLSYDAIRMRVPGRCVQGDYDCGLGQCVPIQQFRDGKPDCMDGSDEWCFIGQVSCGAVYCADYKDMLPCIVNPKCDGSSKQLPWCSVSKEKLCADKTSFPCKGYGECVLWEWLLDGKKDCLDGSDEDEHYVLPLESAFRLAKNKTGLVLPQPVAPPPEDHPSLYVQGCSFCPHGEGHTTPKNPFGGHGYPKTNAPLTGFGIFPTTTMSPGEFFPEEGDDSIKINRVTTTVIDDFFVADKTTPTPSNKIPPVNPNVIFVPVTSLGIHPEDIGTLYPDPEEHKPDIIVSPTSSKIPMITPVGAIFKPVGPHSTIEIPHTSDYEISGGDYESSHIGVPGSENVRVHVLPPVTGPHPHPQESVHLPEEHIGSPSDETYSTSHSGPFVKPYHPSSSSSYKPNTEHQGTQPTETLVMFKPGPTPSNSGNLESKYSGELTHPISPEKFKPESISTESSYFENTGQPSSSSEAVFKPVGSGSWMSVSTEPPRLIPMIQPIGPSIIILRPTEAYPKLISPGPLLPSKSHFKPPVSTPWSNPQGAIFKPYKPLPYSSTITSGEGYKPMEHVPSGFSGSGFRPSGSTSPSQPPTEQVGAFFRPWSPQGKPRPSESIESTKPSGPTPPSHKSIIYITENGPDHPTPNSVEAYLIPDHTTSTPQRGSSPGYTPKPHKPNEETTEESTPLTKSPTDQKLIPWIPGHLLPSVPTLITTTEMRKTSEEPEGWIEETTTTTTTTTTEKSQTEETIGTKTSACFVENRKTGIICECEHGQMKNRLTGVCEETSGIMNVKVDMSEICSEAELEDSQQLLYDEIASKYQTCIQPDRFSDNSHIASIVCDGCSLSDVNNILYPKNLKAEGLGHELCDNSDYNHCHRKAKCSSDLEGLRYSCECVPGTEDVSQGYGRECEGFSDETQCILVFGICLIVWLIFLLGVFMLTCLCCIAAYSLFPKLCSRHIAIHPENSDGLRTVVIGKNVKKPAAGGPMPHMRAIFAESLKHSAKGSTSVASAFALVDMKRKRVSKAPEMSQVVEEINESPPEYEIADVTEKRKMSKSDSLARLSEAQITETPILEKNSSSSVSLVSAGNEPAPQLPSLPLSLPIPMTTNNTSPSPSIQDNISEQEKKSETERPSSSHSIGVQPTIWETYRVLGQQYSKSDQSERKQSLDSLELMFEARLAETHRTEPSPPVTFTTKQTLELPPSPQPVIVTLDEPTSSFTVDVPEVSADPVESIPVKVEDVEQQILKDVSDLEQQAIDKKVAEMIGVSSYHPTPSPQLVVTKENEVENPENSLDMDDALDKSLETALLIEMAKQGIELPLSPKTPVPTLDELEKTLAEQRIKEDSEEQKVIEEINKKIESRRSSTSHQKTKIPSRKSSVSSTSSKGAKEDVFKPAGSSKPFSKTQRFKPRGLQRSGEVTDDSDPEVAFFKRLEAMREEVDKRLPYLPPPRRTMKRRIPERTLSSISEKSAEILTDPEAVDISISCPATTRSLLDPKPSKSRYRFKRKLVEVTGETSDVDIPRVASGSSSKPIVSSPEIPDVTLQRSIEHLNKTNIDIALPSKTEESKKKQLFEKNRRPIPAHPSSVTSSRISSRAVTPRTIGEDSASQTSRSTRHSVISRKIAHRKHELKSISGSTNDLSRRVPKSSSTIRSAKSVGDLSNRPAWNISQHRTSPSQLVEFLPPITATRTSRTAGNSPQPRARRSDSHFSLTSLPAAHSPISFWSSPHFNPSEDSRKPPKEDLWWNPNRS